MAARARPSSKKSAAPRPCLAAVHWAWGPVQSCSAPGCRKRQGRPGREKRIWAHPMSRPRAGQWGANWFERPRGVPVPTPASTPGLSPGPRRATPACVARPRAAAHGWLDAWAGQCTGARGRLGKPFCQERGGYPVTPAPSLDVGSFGLASPPTWRKVPEDFSQGSGRGRPGCSKNQGDRAHGEQDPGRIEGAWGDDFASLQSGLQEADGHGS
jgi:hypothetical protein